MRRHRSGCRSNGSTTYVGGADRTNHRQTALGGTGGCCRCHCHRLCPSPLIVLAPRNVPGCSCLRPASDDLGCPRFKHARMLQRDAGGTRPSLILRCGHRSKCGYLRMVPVVGTDRGSPGMSVCLLYRSPRRELVLPYHRVMIRSPSRNDRRLCLVLRTKLASDSVPPPSRGRSRARVSLRALDRCLLRHCAEQGVAARPQGMIAQECGEGRYQCRPDDKRIHQDTQGSDDPELQKDL